MPMKKTASIAMIAVFLAFIGLFFLLNVLTPDRTFSQRENRYLQQRPAFSLEALFSGGYTEKFEAYTTDQFFLRDAWTTVKARCELLMGKRENNDVFYGEDGVLIGRYTAPEPSVLAENADYLNILTDNVDCPVYFALIPGAAEVWSDRLPPNAPTDSQKDVIDAVYDQSRARNVDMLSALNAHKDEYIFYGTDHHWTSLGAYYGYNALRGALGLPEASLSQYDRQIVTDSFYGTVYSSSGFSWVPPDEIEIFVPDDGSATITNYNASEPEITPLYDLTRLEEKDKYSLFLGGNTPRLVVETGQTDKPRLCIVRDSYTDSLLPFLLSDFSEIDLIDLRYFTGSLTGYIRGGGFDAVLVIYSVANFSTDTNLFFLSM